MSNFICYHIYDLYVVTYIQCKINLAIVLYVSYPPHQAFIVIVLHQDRSAVPGRKIRNDQS